MKESKMMQSVASKITDTKLKEYIGRYAYLETFKSQDYKWINTPAEQLQGIDFIQRNKAVDLKSCIWKAHSFLKESNFADRDHAEKMINLAKDRKFELTIAIEYQQKRADRPWEVTYTSDKSTDCLCFYIDSWEKDQAAFVFVSYKDILRFVDINSVIAHYRLYRTATGKFWNVTPLEFSECKIVEEAPRADDILNDNLFYHWLVSQNDPLFPVERVQNLKSFFAAELAKVYKD